MRTLPCTQSHVLVQTHGHTPPTSLAHCSALTRLPSSKREGCTDWAGLEMEWSPHLRGLAWAGCRFYQLVEASIPLEALPCPGKLVPLLTKCGTPIICWRCVGPLLLRVPGLSLSLVRAFLQRTQGIWCRNPLGSSVRFGSCLSLGECLCGSTSRREWGCLRTTVKKFCPSPLGKSVVRDLVTRGGSCASAGMCTCCCMRVCAEESGEALLWNVL